MKKRLVRNDLSLASPSRLEQCLKNSAPSVHSKVRRKRNEKPFSPLPSKSVMSNILNRLLNPEDFSSAIWPERLISPAFGQWNSLSKTLLIVYGIIMTVVHISLTSTVSYEHMIAHTIGDKSLNGRVFIAWLNLSINFILLPVHIWAWIIVGQSNHILAVTSLTIIDKDFSKIPNCNLNLFTIVKRQLISFIGLIILYVILVIKFSHSEDFRWELFCHMSVHFYPLIIRISTCSNFANVVHFIGERYELINRALKFFRSRNGLRTAKRSQAYDDDDDDDGEVLSSPSILHKLRIIHYKLYFVSRNITDSFSFQLLICLMASFIAGITDFYKIYLSLTSPCYKAPFSQISNHVIETFIDFGCIIYVAYNCHKTVEKATETTQIINSIVLNTEGLYYEASTFSHQLMHYRLRFSPFGLFKLDLISQHSMAATISLYLIIFIQLQPSYVEYECSKNV